MSSGRVELKGTVDDRQALGDWVLEDQTGTLTDQQQGAQHSTVANINNNTIFKVEPPSPTTISSTLKGSSLFPEPFLCGRSSPVAVLGTVSQPELPTAEITLCVGGVYDPVIGDPSPALVHHEPRTTVLASGEALVKSQKRSPDQKPPYLGGSNRSTSPLFAKKAILAPTTTSTSFCEVTQSPSDCTLLTWEPSSDIARRSARLSVAPSSNAGKDHPLEPILAPQTKTVLKGTRTIKVQRNTYKLFQDVLARWTDGLFYLGKVLQVGRGKCHIRFEDQSCHWALFKDIQREPIEPTAAARNELQCEEDEPTQTGRSSREVCCFLCGYAKSKSPNEIVFCNYCKLGYHTQCHIPVIEGPTETPSFKWSCRTCAFARAAKKGGATKHGPNALALQKMKQVLPYTLKSLQWDEHHINNQEQCYCYCGGPGDWYNKMLQCFRCRQWFHEACLQCLDRPLLLGDRFYIFSCSLCNSGKEYLRDLDLKWVDLTHLALFVLTMETHIKYFDFHEVLLPWVQKHRESLRVPRAVTQDEIAKELEHTLQSYCSRFKNGKEIRKRSTWWALRERAPPSPPMISLSKQGPVTDDLVDPIITKLKRTKPEAIERVSILVVPLKPKQRKRKASLSEDIDGVAPKPKRPRKSSQDGGAEKSSSSQSYKGYAGDDSMYVVKSNGHAEIASCPASVSEPRARGSTDSPAKNTLENIIPRPTSYEGFDHPFKTVLERNQEIATSKLKEKLLNTYTNGSLNCDEHEEEADAASLKEVGSDAATLSHTCSTTPEETMSEEHALLLHQLLKVKRHKRGRPSKAELNALKSRAKAASEIAKKTGSKVCQQVLRGADCGTSRGPRASTTRRHPARVKNVVDKSTLDSMSDREVSLMQLKSSVNTYFGAASRLAHGEGFRVCARRVTPDGKVQYLVEWEGGLIG